jgi:hypothetical protein
VPSRIEDYGVIGDTQTAADSLAGTDRSNGSAFRVSTRAPALLRADDHRTRNQFSMTAMASLVEALGRT